ncbi:hypothetical protein BJ944DRAFT_264651 [Cunninghamella echinulata]|nr:hypothetical protein BJ944DRAFT_264651 [Cunninghamella echinulata]
MSSTTLTLKVLPLISSTMLTTIGIGSLITFPTFLNTTPSTITQLFKSNFNRQVGWVIGSGSFASLSGIYVYHYLQGNRYYRYGYIFSAIHFLYVPIIMGSVERLFYTKQQDQPYHMKKWLKIHSIRLITDIAATVCYSLALINQLD